MEPLTNNRPNGQCPYWKEGYAIVKAVFREDPSQQCLLNMTEPLFT